MKQFLVFGGKSNLAECFSSFYGSQSVFLGKSEGDITDKKAVECAFKKYPSKFVLNCAAVTDIELCEKNPRLCLSVNTIGPYILSEACLKHKRKFIHISSDYAENPLNTYGWSKYLSERFLAGRHLAVRTNFYHCGTFIVKELLLKHRVNAYKNVFFNPVSINRLVREIYKIRNAAGIKNIFTSKKISYLTFAGKFCSEFGLDSAALVRPAEFVRHFGKTPRPLNSCLKSDINIDIDGDLAEFKKFLLGD